MATESDTRARARLLAGAFVAILTALIVHNVYWARRNQRELDCEKRVCVWPRDIAQVAARNLHNGVNGQLAIYYLLAQTIPPGRQLTVTPAMAPFARELREIARMDVTVSGEPLLVDRSQVKRLFQSPDQRHRRFLVRGGSRRPQIYRDFYILPDPTSEEYVLAEAKGGPFYLLPRRRYEAVRQPR